MNKTRVIVKRGSIYNALLSGALGSEQDGVRPVLVIINKDGGVVSPVVTVVPITSKQKINKLSNTDVNKARHINIECDSLDCDSIALTEQVRTIDKLRLKEKLGEVTEVCLNSVVDAVFRNMSKNF